MYTLGHKNAYCKLRQVFYQFYAQIPTKPMSLNQPPINVNTAFNNKIYLI